MNTSEKIEVMQDWKEGNTIEYCPIVLKDNPKYWVDWEQEDEGEEPVWDWGRICYRKKVERE